MYDGDEVMLTDDGCWCCGCMMRTISMTDGDAARMDVDVSYILLIDE